MKHFLITRFNIRFEQWETAKTVSLVLTDEWLNDRFNLFQKYCLPSVINQKNQNFYWVVFFDTETPIHYREIVNKISIDYNNFHPVYINDSTSLQSSLKQFIREHLTENDEFIITSRLDNDDAIHQNFISTVQNLARKENELVIDLRNGIQMNISNNLYEFRNYYNVFNQFISFVENSSNFNTVLSRKHKDWKNSDSIIVYDSEKLWIELIHNKNKLNTVKSFIPLTKNIKLNEFGIVEELKHVKELKQKKSLYILIYNINPVIYMVIIKVKRKLSELIKRIK